MSLVEVNNSEVYCDSLLVAKKFEKKHANVVDVIKKVELDLLKIRVGANHPKIFREQREYRGTKYTGYLMNREFFSLLVNRFRGKKALEWQIQFNQAFYQMESQLIKERTNAANRQWLGARVQGKIGRKEETEVIKDFVEYATKQGSTKSKYYYKHITNAAYAAMGLMCQKKPKLRDTLDVYQIGELLLMERFVRNKLKHYMDLGRDYKDIYESVKNDMLEYGKILSIK